MIAVEDLHDHIVIRASGTLTEADYRAAVPQIDDAIEHVQGPVRVLLRLEGLRGMQLGALWEELAFDIKHRGHVRRMAVVGDRDFEKLGTLLLKPFSSAELRYFPAGNEAEAKSWLLR